LTPTSSNNGASVGFSGLIPAPARASDIGYLIEQEEKLAETPVCVVADRSLNPDSRSLRWDILGVGAPTGVMQAAYSRARVTLGGRELLRAMPAVHFTNLLIAVAVGLLAPLALGFFPRFLTALGFAVSFAIALVLGLGLKAGGFVKSPLFVAIVLVATSLGVIVPVLKDSGNISTSFGQLVIAAASIADFGAIILFSLFFSGSGSTSTTGTLILLGVFGLVVLLVGLAIAGVEHSMSLTRVLQRLQDTTAQIRVRAAFLLLIGFTALAEKREGGASRRSSARSPPARCSR
jgi:hypothetical protein